jgi:sarcosine oxidase
MRIAVLGLGGVGTAAARFAAQAGHQVVGFEQFQLDHDRGSSYGTSRIIRRVYPDPLYAAMMEYSYPLWEELNASASDPLFVRCGGLFFGPEGDPEMAASEAALQQLDVPHERLTASAAMRRFPAFRLGPQEYGLFDPDSGFLHASRCVRANAAGAREAGAELREGIRIDALETGAAGVVVRSSAGAERFDRVIVAAGPWSGSLLAPWARLPLTVTRQQYAHFAASDSAGYEPGRFPIWIDMAREFYGFPQQGEVPGVKVALHRPGPPTQPDDPDRDPGEAATEVLRAYNAERLPGLTREAVYRKVCLYTMTPTHDFIVDRLPNEPRVVVVAGLSGHGFKFTLLLGRLALDLALERNPPCDLRRFALPGEVSTAAARFGCGSPGG